MNNAKPILYDLGISLGAISLWLTPVDILRLVGYSTSLVFAGDAYLRGLALVVKERRTDEKVAIAYEAETDFYDQLLSQTTEAKLEIAALEVETRMLERLIPLVQQKNRLEQQLNQMSPQQPQESGSGDGESVGSVEQVDEECFRKIFPAEMDGSTWKAICKGMGEGLSREEIVNEVLGCSSSERDAGNAYFTWLKNRHFSG